MESITAKRNSLFAKVKRELETAERVKTQNPSLSEVRERLVRLEALGNSFFDVQDQFEDGTSATTLENLVSVFDYRKEFEDRYYAAKAIYAALDEGSGASDRSFAEPANNLKTAVAALLETQRALLSNQAAHAAQLNQIQQGNPPPAGQPAQAQPDPFINVRLPPINIPKYAGVRKEWLSFKDLFVSTIYSKESLRPSQKLHSFGISDDNYPLAWDKLLRKYDQKKYTVFALVKEFLDQPVVSDATAGNLQKLVTTSDEVVRQLDVLGEQYQSRDPWLIQLLLEKIDEETQALWAQKLVTLENPSLTDFLKFLEDRCDAIETCSSFTRKCTLSGAGAKKEIRKQPAKPAEKKVQSYVATPQPCPKCSKEHLLFLCEAFKASSVADRRELVQKSRLCFNCLRTSHTAKTCSSKHTCKTDGCNQRHHTLLCQHGGRQAATAGLPGQQIAAMPVQQPAMEAQPTVPSFKAEVTSDPAVKITVLPTALVKLRGKNGVFHTARAMIDSCSGASLISEACMTRLGISRSNARFPVTGVAGTQAGTTRGMALLEIAPRFSDEVVMKTQAYVLEVLAPPTPCQSFKPKQLELLRGLQLADPEYYKAGPVDVILGAELFLPILQAGQVTDEDGLPVAQKSSLGWLVAGKFGGETMLQTNLVSFTVQLDVNIDQTLRKFWETEEVPAAKVLTADEKRAVDIFNTTTRRNDEGRFVVRLPFDDSKPALGDSLGAALRRLHAMERKFLSNPPFKQAYRNFMSEYQQLGHMELIPQSEVDKHPSECFYLPHHAVQKEDSSTTKLRVVFDGSCRTSSGVSLNDRLLIGPNNNEDLYDVYCRFRTYPVVFVSDIEKMYRQVRVDKQDTDFQRIVWRDDPDQPVQHYRLTTVTYGTSSAAYLATESLRQAARDNAEKHPVAADRILKGFYVDDLMSGADTVEEAQELAGQITTILGEAGFVLRKWSSNAPELLENIADSRQGPVPVEFTNVTASVKALGIHWSPTSDWFEFKVNLDINSPNTKLIVKIKIIFQLLWLYDLLWDDPLPPLPEADWNTIKQTLHLLERIRVPRRIPAFNGKLQLLGFSDASESAYSAVVYGRSADRNGKIHIVLICVKTKVAPIQQICVPKLELNGSWLLAALMKRVSLALCHLELQHFAFTDSAIVLEWSMWHHVSSKDNPADCASRGISPLELLNHPLWWDSPYWAHSEQSFLEHCAAPAPKAPPIEERQIRTFCLEIGSQRSNFTLERYLLDRFSSLRRCTRTLATIRRFLFNLARPKVERLTGPLTPAELKVAGLQLVRLAQHEAFAKEIACLRKSTEVSNKSKLRPLFPFIDRDGTLRVGGRLQNADIPYDMRHPPILPQQHRLTTLVIQDLHLDNLHAGPTLVISTLNQSFWVMGCQTVVRQQLQKCIRCCRMKARTAQQLMGSLPAVRTTPARAFVHVGVDYAGPILVKSGNPRKPHVTKGYIAVFVCLCTKAVHLEVAGDLSTKAFFGALKRFVARRGLCTEIWSDNGTNFVGADRQMQEFFETDEFKQQAAHFAANIGVKWTFIPPSAPHMGGLWEAAVKSAKTHLRKVLGNESATYEELYTILTQIEACLNSRPLCAISNSPDSCEALTPGHFIIQQPMNLLPEPSVSDVPRNRLDNWQLVQQKVEEIWTRWRNEYVTSLQPRSKWQSEIDNLQVNRLVLVKNENTPPAQWELARVVATHPDRNGIVRTVTLRRGTTEYQRPIQKLVPLPTD
ncbi:uncharacterized protein LOC120426643 [Culex pipiens pallens]|uniref:uncharacterized protein LOC120426643 n=1 Tax=Culex pipiens pallens TaxID=42434 RepID=UPI0019546A46|nr:uncharacterized protein LOC120426643 [Culex pipiens pallens]